MNDLLPDRPVLFVLSVTYTAPIAQIEEHLGQHRDWLDKNFKDGTFLVSGPKVPRSGGIILARGTSTHELEGLVETDPFVLERIARYEITLFEPTRGPLAALLVNNGVSSRLPPDSGQGKPDNNRRRYQGRRPVCSLGVASVFLGC